MIEEHITFEDGIRIVVPRPESPKDTGRGPVKPIMVDPREYLKSYKVGPDGPPPVVFATKSKSFLMEVSNLATAQDFWHRSMTHGELHFTHVGSRTVETENGTVSQEPGQFIYFPKGIAHRNIGHPPEVFVLVMYVREDLELMPLPTPKAR